MDRFRRLPVLRAKPMLPDFLLECVACGGRSVWDTDALPPVGCPEVGHPVLWCCHTCGADVRHTIVGLYLATEKLHHEICLAAEVDRLTVDRVMAEVYHRRGHWDEASAARMESAQEAEEVAETAGVSPVVVEQISAAEADWMLRHGYLADGGRAG